MSTIAYPLQWPEGQSRTRYPGRSKFKPGTFGRVRDELLAEIKRMGGRSIVVSTNIQLRQDGLPYATHSRPKDHGVAVYFLYKGNQRMVFACDKWDRIEDNMVAITKTIEAVRGIERWGSSEMMERAFTGFAQIAAPENGWWVVLCCPKDSGMDLITSKYREMVKVYHEAGSSPNTEMMKKINLAYEEAKKARA